MERRPKPFPLSPLDTLFILSMQNYACAPSYLTLLSPLALFLSAHVNAEREPGTLASALSNEDRLLASSDEFLGAGRRDFEMFRGETAWPAKIWNSRWKRWIPRVSLSP